MAAGKATHCIHWLDRTGKEIFYQNINRSGGDQSATTCATGLLKMGNGASGFRITPPVKSSNGVLSSDDIWEEIIGA